MDVSSTVFTGKAIICDLYRLDLVQISLTITKSSHTTVQFMQQIGIFTVFAESKVPRTGTRLNGNAVIQYQYILAEPGIVFINVNPVRSQVIDQYIFFIRGKLNH